MGISQRDVVAHFRTNIDLVYDLQQRWERLDRELRTHRDSVIAQGAEARLELGRSYLLELSADALARAEQLTGYRGFTRRDPLKAMAHEAGVLANTIQRIEADERYVRRQYLVGPEGEHTRALAEAQGMLEPWEEEAARFERLDLFLELVEVKYDTDAFDMWWYQPKYWKYWAAGDRICADLGLNDFGDDVLPAYHEVREPRDQWRAQVAAVEAKIDEVHELVRRRDQAEARIPQLPTIYLDSCQQQLAEFFAQADLGLLEEWLEGAGGDRGVQQVLRRCAGLAAKERFLDELIGGVTRQLASLAERRAKFERKVVKYSRGKYYSTSFPTSVLDQKFEAKAEKYREAPGKLAGHALRIVEFDDYGSFDLNNDPELWYVTMTRKGPSRHTPTLRSWYERHPDAAPVLDDDDDVAAAVYVAAQTFDRTDRGYLS